MQELVYIIVCIILYGCATFFKRLALNDVHPYQLLLGSTLVYTLFIPLWVYLSKDQNIQYNPVSILYVVMYAIFNVIAGLILGFLLRSSSSPGTLIAMVNLSAAITMLLSFIFLHEQFSLNKIIAFILAIASILVLNL